MENNKQLVNEKLFNILKEFKRVCAENDLKYSLYAGTLIGAIREDDFIPWDDDVDVIMLREDYDKFKKLAENGAFKEPYFLQNPNTDEGSPRMFCRLRDSSTTSVSNTDILLKMNHGIFIDVFPADYVPRDPKKMKKMVQKLTFWDRIAGAYSRYYAKIGSKGDSIKKKIAYTLLYPFFCTGIFTAKKSFEHFEKVASQYKNKKELCDSVADSLWLVYDPKYYFNKAYFENGYTEHTFHNEKFMVFKEYDKLLTDMYGDYMTPVEQPTSHGSLIQRTDISYKEYIKENYDEIKAMWKK